MPKAAAPSADMPADIARMSFEEAMTELDRIVKQREDGKAKLDDAIAAYERGTWLRHHCESKLRDAQMKIEKISQTIEDGVTAKPFTE